MAKPGQHPANLAVLAFVENDAHPGAFALVFLALCLPGFDVAVAQPDTFEESMQIVCGWVSCYQNQIRFLDAEAGMHQAMGEVAVIGQEQQSFAGFIQAADGVDALADVRHEIDRQWPAGRIVVGA